MEEDIKILEEFIDDFKLINADTLEEIKPTQYSEGLKYISPKECKAIENLINKNKEQEKVIELMGEYLSAYAMYSDEESCFCNVKGKDCNEKENVTCKECLLDYFKKKAR